MCGGSCSSDGSMRSQISAHCALLLTSENQRCHCEASVSMIAYGVASVKVSSSSLDQSNNSIF